MNTSAREFRFRKVIRWAIGLALIVSLSSGCAIFQDQEDESHEEAEWHYDMAVGYFESGDTTHAIRELVQAIEYDSEHVEAHYLLGFIYQGRRDYPNAVNHFERALEVDPDYYQAKNNLGTVYMEMERWEEAAEMFDALLEEQLYTTPELAHNNLGWAYYNLERYSQALEHLRMAVHLSPEMCLADNNKGRVYEAMGNTAEAERHYRRAIEKCPQEFQEPHFHLGKLLQDRGDASASAAHFERCIEIRSQNDLAERCRQYLQLR